MDKKSIRKANELLNRIEKKEVIIETIGKIKRSKTSNIIGIGNTEGDDIPIPNSVEHEVLNIILDAHRTRKIELEHHLEQL